MAVMDVKGEGEEGEGEEEEGGGVEGRGEEEEEGAEFEYLRLSFYCSHFFLTAW